MIYLEPRSTFDPAIIGTENDLNIYCYWMIVDQLCTVCQMEYIEAIEYIEYNILGTMIQGWPIILDTRDEDDKT
jgi:hypothetical protein